MITIGERSATRISASRGKEVLDDVEEARRRISSAPFVLTASEVAAFLKNFELFHRVVGERGPGSIQRDSAEMIELLQRMDAHLDEMLGFQRALDTLSIDTQLRRSYLEHDRKYSDLPVRLLDDFENAQVAYAQCPQMRGFGGENRKDAASGRGEKLRAQLQQAPRSLSCEQVDLDFVDYEIKPLNINCFEWQGEGVEEGKRRDIRLNSVDLLMRFGATAMLSEVKMAGDTWPSSGLEQLLFYASMMANPQQMDRLAGQYAEHFEKVGRMSLGLFCEQRDDAGFPADLLKTLKFLGAESTKKCLGRYFDGILVLELALEGSAGDRWCVASECWISWS